MLTTPKSRIEQYLADLVGQEGATIPDEPKSRIEAYLDYIIKNGVVGEVSFKGIVATVSDLPEASADKEGWIYKCTADGGIYFCDGTQWENLADSEGTVSYKGTVPTPEDLPTASAAITGNMYTVVSNGNVYFCNGSEWVNLSSGGGGSSTPPIDYIYGGYEGVDLTQKFAAEIANYTDEWAWIKARITAGNFEGIHIHDYIPVTFTDANATVMKEEVAGINTYKGSGYIATSIGNHIDFISRELWKTASTWNDVNNNNAAGSQRFVVSVDGSHTTYQLCSIKTNVYPRLKAVTVDNAVTTNYTYDINTGIITLSSAPTASLLCMYDDSDIKGVPFTCSRLYAYLNAEKQGTPSTYMMQLKEVDFRETGILNYLPTSLVNVISEKYMYMPTRYSFSTSSLEMNNKSIADDPAAFMWVSLGKLWVPDEFEVTGLMSVPYYTADVAASQGLAFSKQYPIFKNGGLVKFQAGSTTLRRDWWLCSVKERSNMNAGYITQQGYIGIRDLHVTNYFYFPICFRIMGDNQ